MNRGIFGLTVVSREPGRPATCRRFGGIALCRCHLMLSIPPEFECASGNYFPSSKDVLPGLPADVFVLCLELFAAKGAPSAHYDLGFASRLAAFGQDLQLQLFDCQA